MPAKALRPMNIRIPESVHSWLKAEARTQERSINFVLTKILEQAQRSQQQGVAQ